MGNALAFVAGVLFCAGLSLSGMTQPGKVVGFLDLGPAWDPSLAFVMVGGIAVYAAAVAWTRRLRRPAFGLAFPGPAEKPIDARLLAGAALFGVGWGLSGFCPGPAVVALVSGTTASFVFVGTMLVAMLAFDRSGRTDG